MADKSIAELVNQANTAANRMRGGSAPVTESVKASDKGESTVSSLFKQYIYDSGSSVPNTVPSELPETPDVNFNIASSGAGDKPFSEIYTEAGVTSSFSVDQLEEMLESPEIKSQPPAMKMVAIPFALKASGNTIDVPLMDAVHRDSALDAYASNLLDTATQAETGNKVKEDQINAEMQEYFNQRQAEIEALRADTVSKVTDYQTFLTRKRTEEQRMSDAISPFLEGKANPITIGNTPEAEPAAVAKA